MFDYDDNLHEAIDAANYKYEHENTDGLSVNMCQGIMVDLFFHEQKPMFGDLLTLCGVCPDGWDTELSITPDECSELNIQQIDEFYGVMANDDLVVGLYPGQFGILEYARDAGPYDYLTLSFNVLKNKPEHSEIFFFTLETLCEILPVSMWKRNTDDIKELTTQLQDEWMQLGIEPGSEEALSLKIEADYF